VNRPGFRPWHDSDADREEAEAQLEAAERDRLANLERAKAEALGALERQRRENVQAAALVLIAHVVGLFAKAPDLERLADELGVERSEDSAAYRGLRSLLTDAEYAHMLRVPNSVGTHFEGLRYERRDGRKSYDHHSPGDVRRPWYLGGSIVDVRSLERALRDDLLPALREREARAALGSGGEAGGEACAGCEGL
jgi:hypothetical protein